MTIGSQTSKYLLLIAILAFATNFGCLLLDSDYIAGDSFTYIFPADNILNGTGFSDATANNLTFRTPVYPLVIALFKYVSLDLLHIVIMQHLLVVFIALSLFIFTY